MSARAGVEHERGTRRPLSLVSPTPSWWHDALLIAALTATAAWVRLPDLYTLPVLTDEAGNDLLGALRAWQAGRLPLVGTPDYLGPLWTWLLMLAFSLHGPSPMSGRTLMAVAGCATVAATYLLGRATGERLVGLIAGALLVPNTVHALSISHIAWSHCLTPLLSTATALSLTLALNGARPALLPVAGLLAGLTLQTHPSTAPILLGLAAGALIHPLGRAWLRSRWALAAVLAAVVGYAPVLIYNLVWPLASVRSAREMRYALHPPTSPAEYLAELARLATQFIRSLASVMEEPPSLGVLLVQPQVLPLLALLVAGSAIAWRRRQPLLPMVLLIGPLLLAAGGGEYAWLPSNSSRFLAPLWPLAFALVGLGTVGVAHWLWVGPARLRKGPAARWWLRMRLPAVLALAALLVGIGLYGPWQATTAYRAWYAAQPRVGDFNAAAYALAQRAATEWPGQTLWLDRELWNDGLEDGGNAWMALMMVLATSGVPARALPTEAGNNLAEARRLIGSEEALLVLPPVHSERLRQQGAVLTPLLRYESGRRRNRGAWAVYRLAASRLAEHVPARACDRDCRPLLRWLE